MPSKTLFKTGAYVLFCALFMMCALSKATSAAEKTAKSAIKIKQGAHFTEVRREYGPPVLSEDDKSGFLPISRKRELYRIDNSVFVVLYFFSGRVKDITVLEDVSLAEARSVFYGGNRLEEGGAGF